MLTQAVLAGARPVSQLAQQLVGLEHPVKEMLVETLRRLAAAERLRAAVAQELLAAMQSQVASQARAA
jgi:hypothetical protein